MEGSPPALRRLIETTRSLVTRSQTTRVSLARLASVVNPEHLPEAIRGRVVAEIGAAVDETSKPVHRNEIADVLKDAWDGKPDDVLDSFDSDPLVVKPHAQTHRGSVDGGAVAIKVLRPGLAAAARNDLALLDVLAAPARAVFPALDVGALTREARERSMDELDFEHEANVQRRAGRALREVDGVEVAAVRLDLCAPEVLVTDFVEHPLLVDALDTADRAAVARALVSVYAGAPRAIGSVLANAKPGDVALAPDGTVWLLHLSAAREVDERRLEAALGAVQALRIGDEESFVLACAALGVLEAEDARLAFGLARDLGGDWLTGPFTLDAAALRDLLERAAAREGEILRLAARATLPPEGLWVGRAAAQTAALLAHLEVEEDWVALALEAAARGWER